MIRFLLGMAAGAAVRSQGPLVRHALAVLLVKTEDAALGVRRFSSQLQEEWEDIVAEARGSEGPVVIGGENPILNTNGWRTPNRLG